MDKVVPTDVSILVGFTVSPSLTHQKEPKNLPVSVGWANLECLKHISELKPNPNTQLNNPLFRYFEKLYCT